MARSPTALNDDARQKLSDVLALSLADGLDLYSQTKVAHWNLHGPHFVALHGQFDALATTLQQHNDELAERVATLGARARGTARQVAKASRLEELPEAVTRDLELVRLLSQRLEAHLGGLRA